MITKVNTTNLLLCQQSSAEIGFYNSNSTTLVQPPVVYQTTGTFVKRNYLTSNRSRYHYKLYTFTPSANTAPLFVILNTLSIWKNLRSQTFCVSLHRDQVRLVGYRMQSNRLQKINSRRRHQRQHNRFQASLCSKLYTFTQNKLHTIRSV